MPEAIALIRLYRRVVFVAYLNVSGNAGAAQTREASSVSQFDLLFGQQAPANIQEIAVVEIDYSESSSSGSE